MLAPLDWKPFRDVSARSTVGKNRPALDQGASLRSLWRPRPPMTVRGPSGRVYASTALGMRPAHPLRRVAIWVVESTPFEQIVLAAIFLNCAVIAIDSMPARMIEVLLLIAFIMEQLLRILAYGMGWHAGTYVRDPRGAS